jgi:hypothetical protein
VVVVEEEGRGNDEEYAVPVEVDSDAGDLVEADESGGGGVPKYTWGSRPSISSANAFMSFFWNGESDLSC